MYNKILSTYPGPIALKDKKAQSEGCAYKCKFRERESRSCGPLSLAQAASLQGTRSSKALNHGQRPVFPPCSGAARREDGVC